MNRNGNGNGIWIEIYLLREYLRVQVLDQLSLLCINDSSLYSKCEKVSGLLDQVEMTSKSELYLKDIIDLG